MKSIWFTICAIVWIPSNLRRGYDLREQLAILRIAKRVG